MIEKRELPPEVDLVLGGGGVKGIALAGAVIELNRHVPRFPRVAGASAGAIAAALIAAYQRANVPLSRLEEDLREVRYGAFVREPWFRRVTGPVGDVAALLVTGAIHSGKYFEQWLGPKLKAVGIETFADLAPDIDWHDPQSLATCPLVVTTTDLTRRAMVRLPWDYHHYGLKPGQQRIVDAVHASMAIPFFFRQFRVHGRHGTATWVDGGVVGSYQITIFDSIGAPAPRPVWGVRLSAEPRTPPDHPVRGVLGMAISAARTVTTDWNRYELADESAAGRTIAVDTGDIAASNFNLDAAQQDQLFRAGEQAARKFI